MTDQEYWGLMRIFNHAFDDERLLIMEWAGGMKVRCTSPSGAFETSLEPEDEDYCGEYEALVGEVQVLNRGSDSVRIYNGTILINLNCIPERIFDEAGDLLWERPKEA